jgi:flagellum-specific peptidoglycan hydrolase FlgJ
MDNTFTIIYPNGKTEKKIEGEAVKANSLVKQKQQLKAPKKSLTHLLGALGHAMRWDQLKQNLNYPILLQTAKKRWYVGAAAAAIGIFFMFPRSEAAFQASNQSNGQTQQASLLAVSEMGSRSDQTKKEESQATQTTAAKVEKAEKTPEAEAFSMPVIPEASRKESRVLKELGRHAKDLRDSYIERYAKVAQGEQDKYGIPASVSLGLAILQSDFGTNIVAKEGDNHLLVSCEMNPIPMGKGMTGQGVHAGVCYTRYESVWMSFRAHSELIKQNYAAIQSESGNDYKKWAKGLEAAGYFKNSYNAKALIQTIETYKLQKFDR